MDAVILAAGEGARLKGWTSDKPKGMITLGNAPILEHIVRGLASSGIQKINMVVGYRKNIVMSYFGDGSQFGIKIKYIEQAKLSGTLDALSLGLKGIEKDFLLDDVHSANEVFVTGTFAGIVPVISVDGKTIGSSKTPITDRIKMLYRKEIGYEEN